MLKFSILVIFDGNSYRKNHTVHLFIKRSQYCTVNRVTVTGIDN